MKQTPVFLNSLRNAHEAAANASSPHLRLTCGPLPPADPCQNPPNSEPGAELLPAPLDPSVDPIRHREASLVQHRSEQFHMGVLKRLLGLPCSLTPRGIRLQNQDHAIRQ